MMHGIGQYKDKEGMLWNGVFVNNCFESKLQKKLMAERSRELLITGFTESAKGYFTQFFQVFEESDKKTYKDNLAPFFTPAEDQAAMVVEPYPDFGDNPPDKWNDLFHALIDGECKVVALTNKDESTILPAERVLMP